MSSTKNTGSGSAGPSKAGTKGKGKAADRTPKQSNIEVKANVRDAIGGIEIEMDGEWMPAVYLDEIRDRVKQDTDAQGSYDHPPAKGTAALDVTAFHADHQSWGESRDQRPKILFEYKRLGREDPDYEVGIWMDNGRVVLGPDGLPIRDFRDIPKLCSSQMEGFRMEAISRLDSRIAISDFRARMMRDGLPGANAISMRKTRFRNRGRCLAWDRRAGSDFYEVQLRDEMTAAMIDRNSTEDLEDLTSARTEKLQLDTAGKAPARSGKRALPEDVRALRFKTAREKNQKKLEAEAKLKQENTEQKSGSLERPQSANNDVVNATKRKRTTDARLAESLHGYVDELLEEERPSKKRRNHESPSTSPEVLDAKKRKRTTGDEAEWDDEEADEGRTFKRTRYSYPLDLLPSPFSLVTPGTSNPPPERVYSQSRMANTEQETGPSSLQNVGTWAREEEPDWRVDNPLHPSRGLDLGDADQVLDDREIIPATPRERARLQNALLPTRRHYEFVTQRGAPDTNPGENYLSQWSVLQLSFNDVWREVGLADQIPLLAGLDMWTPGSLVWNGSTAQLLDLQGVDGRSLFNELQDELRDGLDVVHNRRAPSADLAARWVLLGQLDQANGEASGLAAPSEQYTGDQPLSALDPFSVSELFAEDEPSATINPSAIFGQSSPSASIPASDPFADFNPSALWEPTQTQTSEAQASFMEPLPASAGPSMMATAVATPAGGNTNGLSSTPGAFFHQSPNDDFQTWLHAEIAENANIAPLPATVEEDGGLQGAQAFESAFFNDATRINGNSAQDHRLDGAQGSPLFAPPSLPTAQGTVRPEEPNTPGLADDFEMFTKASDFWLS